MAGSIKGIIVEIGGDTSGLQKALSKVNSATSSLSKELRGVNSLLKLDPKNTELLKQKQDILNDSVKTTEEKLQSLKDVQEQVKKQWDKYKEVEPQLKRLAEAINKSERELKQLQEQQEEAQKAFKEGKIAEEQYKQINEAVKKCKENIKDLKAEQKELGKDTVPTENYRAFQREIAESESKLKRLKNEASNWNKAGQATEKIGDRISRIGSKIDNLGNKLTTRSTLPIATGFTLMTKSAIKNETAMQQVEKIYGKASESIKDFAENQAINYNMSLSEAYKYSQIYGNLIQSITDDESKNAKYTQDLLKASAVIASSTGRTMEDVMDRIRSGLLGNTEAIEDLGVNVNVALLQSTDAFKKFAGDKSWNQLDFQTQQQIRLFGILEQTTKKYGDEINQNTTSNIQQLTAKTKNLTNNLGKKLMPTAKKLIDKANDLISKFGNLSDEEQENIIKTGLMVVAAGPLVKILGTTTKTIGTTVKGIGIFSQAIGVMKTGAESSSESVNTLAKVLSGITNPSTIAAVGVTAAVGVIIAQINKAEEETKTAFSNMGTGASEFIKGIDSATSHLDSFNSTLFASSEEQQKLQEDMNNIQKGITDICKKASDERRGYTQEEIAQLDEYFIKLRELKNRELEIQKSISNSITQQAQQNAETFQGTLEEYKVNSQEWIKTAQEQADKEISIINDRTTQEIALLQQRYGEKAEMENEEYAREYNAIQENKNKAIQEANDEVAKVNLAYSNGYLKRSQQQDSWYSKYSELNSRLEEAKNNHIKTLEGIDNNFQLSEEGKRQQKVISESNYNEKMKKIWKDMYENMSYSESKQLGSWLGMIAQTELYGGKIETETQNVVDNILNHYNGMSKKTQEAMKEAMQPMLEEMEKKEPSLYAKASGIANGILSRLKKSFDIHSPSRETRKIFKNVMASPEEEMEKGRKILSQQAENIANDVLRKFDGMVFESRLGAINKSIIERNQTVFTTPQIVFNVQELDEVKLQQCFNYINKKFGSAY